MVLKNPSSLSKENAGKRKDVLVGCHEREHGNDPCHESGTRLGQRLGYQAERSMNREMITFSNWRQPLLLLENPFCCTVISLLLSRIFYSLLRQHKDICYVHFGLPRDRPKQGQVIYFKRAALDKSFTNLILELFLFFSFFPQPN